MCSDDWGWYKTVTMNLEKAIAAAPSVLKGDLAGLVEQRARQMIKAIEETPKSMGWQVRARLGERRAVVYRTRMTGRPEGWFPESRCEGGVRWSWYYVR